MKRTITMGLFAGAVFGLVAFAAHHGDQSGSTAPTPVLLELFTSEGCSDCPPADRLLEYLDKKQPVKGARLIVLSEHVDYWNHLGWTDPYSLHLFSERQESYTARLHVGDVYTPELVVDGQAQLVGSDEAAALAMIRKSMERPKVPVSISGVSKEGSNVRLHVNVGALPIGSGSVYVALADSDELSQVPRGENAGRTLTHVAVVRSLTSVAESPRHRQLNKDLTLPLGTASAKSLRLIAFVQDKSSGAVLGATQTFLD